MSEASALFAVLRQVADADVAASIERLIADAPDRDLNRINLLEFAKAHGLPEDKVIAGFLHASRLGLFDFSWNMLCPGCSGVLGAHATLKLLNQGQYHCALCAAGYEASLDESVELTFTVNPRFRRIAAHDPDTLPIWEYFKQVFWSSGIDLPQAAFDRLVEEATLDAIELPAGEKALLSLQVPEGFIIVFEPVTHAAQFFNVQGEPTKERQQFAIVFNDVRSPTGTADLRPGPLRLSAENRTARRVLPSVWLANDALHDLLGQRRPFLTATRILTHQTFRDIYKADVLSVDQRLKITGMTFLFTDLKGSTELYDRIGDLAAFELVKGHFHALLAIIASESGAVVKTIGDAVMATFPTPEGGVVAALRMRRAMNDLNLAKGSEDLILKIGLHQGPCLAVTLNDQQDFFGQTVNIAARVQGLATGRAILATGPVIEDPAVGVLLSSERLTPVPRTAQLRGVAEAVTVYEIP